MGKPLPVVGVMPPGFAYPEGAEVWTRGVATDQPRGSRSFLQGIARLKPGVRLEQAQAEMRTIAQRLSEQYRETNGAWTVDVISLQELRARPIRPALLVLTGAAGLVLLVCCTNVTNLLLARGLVRRKEITIRAALGASRARMVRQLFTESLLLACLGGSMGLALAFGGVRLLVALAPGGLPRIAETSLDLRVLAFTLLLATLSCLLFGLGPALEAARTEPQEVLKESARGVAGGLRLRRLGSALVAGELALSLVLLIGAWLLIESFIQVEKVDLGFRPENLLTMRIMVPRTESERVAFFQQAIARIQALPGVKSVGAPLSLPLRGGGFPTHCAFVIEGRPLGPEQEPYAAYQVVTPDYFQTMGIPLLGGRPFTQRDEPGSARVAIINKTLAQRFWPEGDAVGKKLRLWFGSSPLLFAEKPADKQKGDKPGEDFSREIVGVVGDVKSGTREAPAQPEIYVPHTEDPSPALTLVIRTATHPLGLVSAVRREVWAVDKDQPVYDIRTMDQILWASISERRFQLLLLSVFAGLALMLAAVGIYGVVAYSVTQRTHEIGIRMALGASAGDVLRLVMRQAVGLILLGISTGLALASALTRILASLLFGVSATDPTVFTAASFLLGLIALASCYFPARRAMRLEPMIALRYE